MGGMIGWMLGAFVPVRIWHQRANNRLVVIVEPVFRILVRNAAMVGAVRALGCLLFCCCHVFWLEDVLGWGINR
jgi:hypothetical protein